MAMYFGAVFTAACAQQGVRQKSKLVEDVCLRVAAAVRTANSNHST